MNPRQVTNQEILNYRLRTHKGGVCLDLWENEPEANPGDASFRFFVTYELKSADEAQAILDRYLKSNHVLQAVPSQGNTNTPVHLRTLVDAPSSMG